MARVGFFLFLTFVAATLAGGAPSWSDSEIGPIARVLIAGFAGLIPCDERPSCEVH